MNELRKCLAESRETLGRTEKAVFEKIYAAAPHLSETLRDKSHAETLKWAMQQEILLAKDLRGFCLWKAKASMRVTLFVTSMFLKFFSFLVRKAWKDVAKHGGRPVGKGMEAIDKAEAIAIRLANGRMKAYIRNGEGELAVGKAFLGHVLFWLKFRMFYLNAVLDALEAHSA